MSGGDFRAPELGLFLGIMAAPADLPPSLGPSHQLSRTQALSF